MKRRRRVGRPLVRTTVVAMAWGKSGAGVNQGYAQGAIRSSSGAKDETQMNLQKLGELWLSGAITKAEFEARNANILGAGDERPNESHES